MSVEQQIEKLNQEIKAVKSSFEQSATMMKVYSTEITFSTSMNAVVFSNPSYDPFDWSTLVAMPRVDANTRCGQEPIIVTFNCDRGINTFATLEVKPSKELGNLESIKIRRIPYSGGSRWLVIIDPDITTPPQGWSIWQPNVLTFVVKSAVQGQLGAKMIWQ